jgi:hypothetical protein
MRPEEADGALKLRAEDVDDLAVISACLQDALIPVRDIVYLPQDKSFVFAASRFRWEAGLRAGTPMPGAAGCERILSLVAFDAVEGVRYRGFRRGEHERLLSLLAVRPELAGDRGGAIHLDFSGGVAMRLAVGRIRCRLKDVGLPWPTAWRPAHDLGERP